MADNTNQIRWIVTTQGGLDASFRDNASVFVAGGLLWYPGQGNNTIRAAPDIFVAMDRPKGDRGSCLQWLEGDIAPQVTFEILSPGNRAADLINQFRFHERHDVLEYYVWDPDDSELSGRIRDGAELKPIAEMHRHVSPRPKVRSELFDGDLRLFGPDGSPLATYVELVDQREKSQARADRRAA